MKIKFPLILALIYLFYNTGFSQTDVKQETINADFNLDSAVNSNYNYMYGLMDSAEINYKTGNYFRALNYYDTILEVYGTKYILENYNEDSSKNTLLEVFAQTSSKLYNQRGATRLKLEDLNGALQDFDLAIKYNTKNTNARFDKAITLGRLGRFEESLLSFNEVLNIDNSNHFAFFLRGSVKADLGDMEGACQDWKKAKELGNQSVNTYIETYCK